MGPKMPYLGIFDKNKSHLDIFGLEFKLQSYFKSAPSNFTSWEILRKKKIPKFVTKNA